MTTEIRDKSVNPLLEFSTGQQVGQNPENLGLNLVVAPLERAEEVSLHLFHPLLDQPLGCANTGS